MAILDNKKMMLIGLKGEKGDTGTITTTTDPSLLPSPKDGDVCLITGGSNYAIGDIYKRVNGAWQLQGNIRGAQGEQGEQGIQGETGYFEIVRLI